MLNYIKSVLMNVAVYVLQFVVMPVLVPKYFPQSNEAYLFFGITVVVASVLSVFILKLKIHHLLVADIVYILLIIIYSSNGAYGIGMNGINLDGLQAGFSRSYVLVGSIVATIILLFMQLVAIILEKIITTVLLKFNVQ